MAHDPPPPLRNISFRNDKDLNVKFIHLRGDKFKSTFTGAKYTNNQGYAVILKDLGYEPTEKNIKACTKRWENLQKDYKVAKNPPSGAGTTNGEVSRTSFAYMEEMDAVLSGNHNIEPPVLLSPNENQGVDESSSDSSETDDPDFDAPGPSSAPVRGRKKKRKMVSTPKKSKEPKEEPKKKRSSMGSKIEESLAKSDGVTADLVKLMKQDVKERRKGRRENARQNKAFLKILAAGILAKQPGNEEAAAKMAQSAIESTDSDSGDSSLDESESDSDE